MKRDLVYFSPIPWRGLYQRPQHTARILSETRRVLFVEPRTLHVQAPPADEGNLSFIALPVIPTNARRPFLRALARVAAAMRFPGRIVALRQEKLLAAKLAALALESPMLLFGHPEFHALRRLLPDSPLAYDHMDDILRFGEAAAGMRRTLEQLAREADHVNATSSVLAEQMRAFGARSLSRIGNGVEWKRFVPSGMKGTDAPLPAEPRQMAALPKPRVIYSGSVAEWFDWDLLFGLARSCPEMQFPVIGPVRPALTPSLNRAPGNVHFFGAKPYEEVPAWLAHSQAALIPFRINPLTAAVDPVKIYEYLAAGLPVLTTPFSAEIRELAGPVILADNADEFATALRRCLDMPPDPEKQRDAAESHRWERLIGELAAALDRF